MTRITFALLLVCVVLPALAGALLTSLRSSKRWRLDADKLIIEGDAARLLLKPGVAELKPDRKPARKKAG
jgi:hypothetical protein